MPLKTIKNFGRWIGKQVDGFLQGLMQVADAPAGDWVPPSIWDTLMWLVTAVGWSFGTSRPYKQITSSVTLLILAVISSWVTLGATLALVMFFAVTTAIGVARLVPAIDAVFVRARDAVIP